jgi:hypothetical protein
MVRPRVIIVPLFFVWWLGIGLVLASGVAQNEKKISSLNLKDLYVSDCDERTPQRMDAVWSLTLRSDETTALGKPQLHITLAVPQEDRSLFDADNKIMPTEVQCERRGGEVSWICKITKPAIAAKYLRVIDSASKVSCELWDGRLDDIIVQGSCAAHVSIDIIRSTDKLYGDLSPRFDNLFKPRPPMSSADWISLAAFLFLAAFWIYRCTLPVPCNEEPQFNKFYEEQYLSKILALEGRLDLDLSTPEQIEARIRILQDRLTKLAPPSTTKGKGELPPTQ